MAGPRKKTTTTPRRGEARLPSADLRALTRCGELDAPKRSERASGGIEVGTSASSGSHLEALAFSRRGETGERRLPRALPRLPPPPAAK